MEGMKGIADRLVAATQWLSKLTGIVATTTCQEDSAAAHGKAMRGPPPRFESLLLLGHKGVKGDRFTPYCSIPYPTSSCLRLY